MEKRTTRSESRRKKSASRAKKRRKIQGPEGPPRTCGFVDSLILDLVAANWTESQETLVRCSRVSKAWHAGCHERMRKMERLHWRSRLPENWRPWHVSVVFHFRWAVGILPEIMREIASNGNDITSVCLRCRCLGGLPKELFLLDRLKKLTVYCPQLSILPKDVKSLRNLEEFYVSITEITFLPDELAQLPRLSILVASDNRLRSLPDNLHLYPNLQRLEVMNNPILWGDKELKFPPSLETFWYTEEETGSDVRKTFS